MAQLAEPLMKKGGTLFTMTYYGSQTVVKNYNIMGVAKAALESAVALDNRSDQRSWPIWSGAHY
jgi:enoyl-[acyl-carrier-protein] reductase (NADH)